MAIYKVGVVGGGMMGRGIAQLVAYTGGLPVVVKELNKELAEQSNAKIQKTLDDLAQRGKSKAEMAKNLITVTDDWIDFHDVDLVIEAVVENMEVKQKVFGEAFLWLHDNTIMVSNTSALSISKMAEAVTPYCRDRIAGLHFFNPPHQLKLVELIRANQTSDQTLSILEDFAINTIGRTVVKVKECPGFLVNRLLMPYLNEAAVLLMETNLTPEEIDNEAQEFGWPMGPFMLMDMLGIDVAAEVAKSLHQGYGERAKPSPLLNKLVELKRFGNKTGAGFYGEPSVVEIIEKNFPYSRQGKLEASEGFFIMTLGLMNEAFLCLEEGVASAEDIETTCLYGIGFPASYQGPLHCAEKDGLKGLLDLLHELEKNRGLRFKPSKLLIEYVYENRSIFPKDDW